MRFEESFLRDIACLVGILEQTERQRKNPSLVAFHQGPKRPLIAPSTTLDQLGFDPTLFLGRRIAGSPTGNHTRRSFGLGHRYLTSRGRQRNDLC